MILYQEKHWFFRIIVMMSNNKEIYCTKDKRARDCALFSHLLRVV